MKSKKILKVWDLKVIPKKGWREWKNIERRIDQLFAMVEKNHPEYKALTIS